jgi:hypothetical protein
LRLRYFGADLNPAPIIIESPGEEAKLIDLAIARWSRPKPLVQALVNGERLERWQLDWLKDVESQLKGEAERLHRELIRRSPDAPWWRSPIKVALAFAGAVAGPVAAAVILHYGFGIG